MIEVTKKAEPEIKYPVGRKSKIDGSIVIFWKEGRATVAFPGESKPNAGSTYDGLISCMDENTWEPVDMHIYG
ncbi:hypothetical protein [Snodgrassella alvi]|uniref:Uncharacterized protein n=1 Tax=Snodgrassella alvi TaxID=1196083 RepID=A0A2N9XW39_9NEIS|nr:hypothetical protein [Snodgrassella alvi]PIT53885.1 hypothetical protein BHC49_09310 [Snodgrassella alvi]